MAKKASLDKILAINFNKSIASPFGGGCAQIITEKLYFFASLSVSNLKTFDFFKFIGYNYHK